MKPSRNPSSAPAAGRTLDLAVLSLIGLASIGLVLAVTALAETDEARLYFTRILSVVFLLLSLLLVPGIVASLLRAAQENAIWRQEPAACDIDPSPVEFRFDCAALPEDLIPHCVEFLEKNFTRYFTFHSFHTPHLFYYYLAKKGSSSLYAPAWIKTGFLIFFLVCCAHFVCGACLSPVGGRLLILGLALFFWLPGFLLLFLAPYRKYWISLTSQGGSVQLTATCASPFRSKGKESLCRALETSLR